MSKGRRNYFYTKKFGENFLSGWGVNQKIPISNPGGGLDFYKMSELNNNTLRPPPKKIKSLNFPLFNVNTP